MNVRDMRGRNEKLDTFYTLQPLNNVLKLFGLNCIHRDGAALKYDWSICKITILILLFSGLNVFNACNKLSIWDGVASFMFEDTVRLLFILGYFQYLLDLFYVYKYGRDQLLEYLDVFKRIDSILGNFYIKDIRRNIIRLIISFSAISIIVCALDLAAWFVNFGMEMIVGDCGDVIYIIIRNFCIADFVAHVTQVLYRLRGIGDLLKGYHSLNETAFGYMDFIDKTNGIREVWKKTTLPVPIKTIDQYEWVIMKLSGCYLLILKQCDHINATYGVRILVICLNSLLDIVTLINVDLRMALGLLSCPYKIYPTLTTSIRILACALVLVYEIHICEQNYKQINRIIRYVDILLITKKIPFNTKDKLRNFRALVTSRPVEFHAVNFYKLDYTLILSLGSVIVTYTLILLQNMD